MRLSTFTNSLRITSRLDVQLGVDQRALIQFRRMEVIFNVCTVKTKKLVFIAHRSADSIIYGRRLMTCIIFTDNGKKKKKKQNQIFCFFFIFFLKKIKIKNKIKNFVFLYIFF